MKTLALRDLCYTRGLDHGRVALAIGKLCGFILVGIDASEFFSVRVGDRDEPVMVLPSLVGIKVLLFGSRGLLSRFFHLDVHLETNMRHYRKNGEFAQVPISVVTCAETVRTGEFNSIDAQLGKSGTRY
jgi:hypothetical protein